MSDDFPKGGIEKSLEVASVGCASTDDTSSRSLSHYLPLTLHFILNVLLNLRNLFYERCEWMVTLFICINVFYFYK